MLRNYVAETSTAPGTSATINLAGAITGRLAWSSVFANGAACFYFLSDGSQTEWGTGVFNTGAPNSLTRTTVLGNSAGTTARLNFTTTTTVYNEVPAERVVYQDASTNVSLPNNLAAAGNATITGSLTASSFAGGGSRMVGEIVDWAGISLPALYLWCAGQAVSRTTYAALFAALSTTYGAGDGSTTFNVPDRRGRASFGRDNMNGTAANRLTAANSGVTGTTLGAVGGDERLPTHTHGTTETPHGHLITDPGHSHSVTAPAGVGVTAGAYSSWSGNGTQSITTATAYTGINNTNTNSTGVSVNNAGSGTAANIPPAFVTNFVIYAAA